MNPDIVLFEGRSQFTGETHPITIRKSSVDAVTEADSSIGGTLVTVGNQHFHVTKDYEDAVYLIFG